MACAMLVNTSRESFLDYRIYSYIRESNIGRDPDVSSLPTVIDNKTKTMDKALQTMIDNMPEKTDKSLDEWKGVLKGKSFAKHSDGVKYLKTEHNVTHGFANTIVSLSKEDSSTEEDLVSAQYQDKENLKPIYDELITYVKSLGQDVIITPKKGSVSIIRKRQFVLIKPATKNRIDLGFKLKDKPMTDRLGSSGSFGTMCTHRVQISDVSEIDKELEQWIKEAYDKSI
jgi:hypothetical protein